MQTIEEILISNKLPYPQHYDGVSWETVTFNSRRCIPKYLKGGLPSMKYQKVKEKFHEMNKFAPPEITYFQKIIKTSRKNPRRSLKSSRQGFKNKSKSEVQLQNLRQDLKYALIMNDRKSGAIIGIVDKISSKEEKIRSRVNKKRITNQDSFEQKLIRTKKSQSLQIGKQTKKCFLNTLDLVFELKKRNCANKSRDEPQKQLFQRATARVNSIRLKTFATN